MHCKPSLIQITIINSKIDLHIKINDNEHIIKNCWHYKKVVNRDNPVIAINNTSINTIRSVIWHEN